MFIADSAVACMGQNKRHCPDCCRLQGQVGERKTLLIQYIVNSARYTEERDKLHEAHTHALKDSPWQRYNSYQHPTPLEVICAEQHPPLLCSNIVETASTSLKQI